MVTFTIIRRLSFAEVVAGSGYVTAIVSFETASEYVNDVEMMIKRDDPTPADISSFFSSFATNSFTVTTDDPRMLADQVLMADL